MLFHLTFKVREGIVQEDIKGQRAGLGMLFAQVRQDPRVKDFRVFGDTRGGYLVVDVDQAVDFYRLLGPELFDNTNIEAHPLVELETAGEIFQEWASQNR